METMMMKFGKQHVPESTAAAALANLNGQIDAMRAQIRATTAEIIELEAKGIEPISPSEAGAYDVHEAAVTRLNGAAYRNAAPQGTKPGIQLYLKHREIAELKVTIDLASRQWSEASIDVGRELLAKHGRKSALCTKSAASEFYRRSAPPPKLRRFGSACCKPVPASLSNWTDIQSLGRRAYATNPMNNWQRKYLSACLAAGIINTRDLEL
jgi:hypothetical protein